jgi:hypothetical protein
MSDTRPPEPMERSDAPAIVTPKSNAASEALELLERTPVKATPSLSSGERSLVIPPVFSQVGESKIALPGKPSPTENIGRTASGGNPAPESGKGAGTSKPDMGKITSEKPNERVEGKPTGPKPPEAKATEVEVAKGVNDLSDSMGKGAKLERGSGDYLTLPDGTKVDVVKDDSVGKDVVVVRIKDPSGKVDRIWVKKDDNPVVSVDGQKTRIQINHDRAEIEAVRTNGKTYKFVPAKL